MLGFRKVLFVYFCQKKNHNMKDDILHEISIRDYFAAQAMLAVMQETQEMRVASFWDWIKHLLVTYLSLTFLTVKYERVENVYEDAAKRAYEYADALLSARLD